MKDNILEVKCAMEDAYKLKDITRTQKYNLILEQSKKLNTEEMELLIMEYKRDCISFKEKSGLTNLINSFLLIVNLLVSISNIYHQNAVMQVDEYNDLIVMVGFITLLIVLGYYIVERFGDNGLKRTRYILDVLEPEYDKKKESLREKDKKYYFCRCYKSGFSRFPKRSYK